MQRCGDCAEMNWFPRGMCVRCSSTNLIWIELSGQATLYSYSLVSRVPNSAFPDHYVLALVDLDEGPRMLTHIVEISPDKVRIGMPLTVRFESLSDDVSLPVFGPKD